MSPKPVRSLLVLIVENDLHTREMYAESLTFSGLRVLESATAEDALEQARTMRPDIIATDIGLPGKDGCYLCQALKGEPRTRSIPVIAVTAWAFGGHVERAWVAGFDSVLIKPVLPVDLLAEIFRVLKLSAAEVRRRLPRA